MAKGPGPRVILAANDTGQVTVPLSARADFICLLHEWKQLPETIRREDPAEGLVAAEYELTYCDGSTHVQPVRGRFEVAMAESPGPPWLALPFNMLEAVDPQNPPPGSQWGWAQTGAAEARGSPLIYAMPNPHPQKRIRSLTIRGCQLSPLIVAGLTLYQGASHPLRHLPRRTYRLKTKGGPARVKKAEIDLGVVTQIEHTTGPRDKAWLKSTSAGINWPYAPRPADRAEDLIEAAGSEDATVSVTLDRRSRPLDFSLGRAFHEGRSSSGAAALEVLGKRRQWMQIRVIDRSTGRPTPARVHFSGPQGQYIAPYGHHAQINTGWFMDYGADVVTGGMNYAYVPGEFTSDMPVGDVYVEIFKGFEYRPVRRKITIRPGQKTLELAIDRWQDWRGRGWITADTHVHFVSPQTAWLEAQCEGVNIINLLASQWGRLFTNVGDIAGRLGVVEDDTIVYVGTENRNHMLGHMSMLGTKGLPVYPMCCGGPSEAYIGDPDFRTMAEWALENRRKGGLVIRPHFPYCGFTEDPVPILKGLVDALEVHGMRQEDFGTQEWYRYLNCGYRVAVVGGTDKMSAGCPIGWVRTYAMLDRDRPLTYENWGRAVRAGRTFSTTGPLIDLRVEGRPIGETIKLPSSGAALEVEAVAESFLPLGKLEVVCNGRVVAASHSTAGARSLRVAARVPVRGSGWIAARCGGAPQHPGSYTVAHTSPVYVVCGRSRAFDGPAAEHMLALVEGGIEYLNTLATAFDEASRKRMVRLFGDAQRELKGRLLAEAGCSYHHGGGAYHTHG
ncbi:MAG TPA: CehA/McbA family metallohydrolase, partial [Polyangia bacterium]|nr:CehA/McbA family metallohydrolase [Polyangia bacterium]